MKLEVIAKSLQDIEVINQSSADRIEFCTNLEIGGLTPSYEEIQKAGEISKLPVNVMLRPHDQGYVYSDEDFEQMLKDAEYIASTNVKGIVVGILTIDGQIDFERMKKIIDLKKDKTITFHRAFQEVKDQIEGLKILHKLGVSTLLTSGGENINQSIELLQKLKSQKLVKVMGGGGVDFDNVNQIKKVVDEVHVGTAIRETKAWSSPISLNKIAAMKLKLDQE